MEARVPITGIAMKPCEHRMEGICLTLQGAIWVRQRPIQTKFRAERCDGLRIGVFAEHHLNGVAGR